MHAITSIFKKDTMHLKEGEGEMGRFGRGRKRRKIIVTIISKLKYKK